MYQCQTQSKLWVRIFKLKVIKNRLPEGRGRRQRDRFNAGKWSNEILYGLTCIRRFLQIYFSLWPIHIRYCLNLLGCLGAGMQQGYVLCLCVCAHTVSPSHSSPLNLVFLGGRTTQNCQPFMTSFCDDKQGEKGDGFIILFILLLLWLWLLFFKSARIPGC